MSKPLGDKDIDIPLEVLLKLLTVSELRMVQNRWEILNLLLDGLSIRKVAEEVHVGTDTVMRTARMLEDESLRKALVLIRTNGEKPLMHNSWVIGSSGEND